MKLTRGFKGRGQATRDPRLPPGQYDTGRQWPVLTAEVDAEARRPPTGRSPSRASSSSRPRGPGTRSTRSRRRRTRATSTASPPGRSSAWSWRACRSTRCSRSPRPLPAATHVLAFSHTGYTTNLPLADVTDGKAWVAWEADGEPLPRDHGGPARLLVPHLYFWKSAKWVAACACSTTTSPGSGSATATTTAATPGSSSATRATDRGRRRGRRRRWSRSATRRRRPKTFRLALDRPTGHRAGQHYVVRLTAPDGYTASRSYSVASRARRQSSEFELTVERLEDGEVSTFLHDVVEVGDELEVRGPIGGYFVWDATDPRCSSAAVRASCPSWRCCGSPRHRTDGPRAPRRVGSVARGPVLRRRAPGPGCHRRVHPAGAAVVDPPRGSPHPCRCRTPPAR